MANNRLYLYCPECNRCLYLGKHFGGNYRIDENIEGISLFLERHRWCDKAVYLCEEFDYDGVTDKVLPNEAIRET